MKILNPTSTCGHQAARLSFRMVDAETQAGLLNAVFRLTHLGGASFLARSDAQGMVQFTLPYIGAYVLTEETPPPGYAPLGVQFSVQADRNGSVWINGAPASGFTIENTKRIPEDLFRVFSVGPNDEPLYGAVFELSKNGAPVQTAITDEAGVADFFNVPVGMYVLMETVAPQGYAPNTEAIPVVVTPDEIIIDGVVTDSVTVVSEPISSDRVDITGEKIWIDNDNQYNTRPAEISIVLSRNGVPYQALPIDASETTASFGFYDVPRYDPYGVEYLYTLGETGVPAGYTVTLNGTTLINGLTPVVVTGNWEDSVEAFAALVVDNSFMGYFESPVVETGVMYAQSMNPDEWMYAPGAVQSPFDTLLTDLDSGPWYYRAYVKTMDETYHYGHFKTETY